MASSPILVDDTTPLLCSIETAKSNGDHVEYSLKVQRGYSSEDIWFVMRRYSDFVNLDTNLKPSGVSIPLPPKKVFGNTSREFIAERQQKLQCYIDAVLANQLLANSLPTKRFLHDDRYQQNLQELALQHISMFLRSEPDWEVVEPLPDIGCRIQKGYFLAKNKSNPKEKYILSWCWSGPYCSIDEKERLALLKTLETLQHTYLYPTKLAFGSKAGAVVIRHYSDKGSLRDMLCKAKPKTAHLKKYCQPKHVAPLSLDEMRVYGLQILEFMKYMQEKSFPLGHIHTGNIFIQDGTVKVSEIENVILGLSPRFRTPVTQHRKLNTMESIDSYSFGCILYEMCFGHELENTFCDNLPPSCPPQVGELFLHLLGSESMKTGLPAVSEILQLPFFSGVVLPSLVKPTVKVPSKLKECLRNTKAHFEGKLIEDQKLIHQVNRRNKLRAHHMSEEEKRKRRLSRKKSAALENADSGGSRPGTPTATSPRTSTAVPSVTTPSAPTPPTAPPAPAPAPPPTPPSAPAPPPTNLPPAVTNPDAGRGALLSSIAGFSKGGLKKTTTVDKSAPKV